MPDPTRILFCQEPPAFLKQALRRHGNYTEQTELSDLTSFDWIGVVGMHTGEADLNRLFEHCSKGGKTFGVIHPENWQMDWLCQKVGLLPAEASDGIILSCWKDNAGQQQYKVIFLRSHSPEFTELLKEHGRNPETLRFFLTRAALQFHKDDFTLVSGWNEAGKGWQRIIPIQRRPLIFRGDHYPGTEKFIAWHRGWVLLKAEHNFIRARIHSELMGAPWISWTQRNYLSQPGTSGMKLEIIRQQMQCAAGIKIIKSDGQHPAIHPVLTEGGPLNQADKRKMQLQFADNGAEFSLRVSSPGFDAYKKDGVIAFPDWYLENEFLLPSEQFNSLKPFRVEFPFEMNLVQIREAQNFDGTNNQETTDKLEERHSYLLSSDWILPTEE